MDEPLAWEVTRRETAYACPGFDVVREAVRLPDGTETDFDYLVDAPSVVVLPFTTTEEIVLIQEWRQAVGRVNRGLPAGTAEPDDADLRETAHRELLEETGYTAGRIDPLLTVEPANGIASVEHHYFVATGCERTNRQSLDSDETIEVRTQPFDAVLDAAIAGEMRDGRSVLGLLYYHVTRP